MGIAAQTHLWISSKPNLYIRICTRHLFLGMPYLSAVCHHACTKLECFNHKL